MSISIRISSFALAFALSLTAAAGAETVEEALAKLGAAWSKLEATTSTMTMSTNVEAPGGFKMNSSGDMKFSTLRKGDQYFVRSEMKSTSVTVFGENETKEETAATSVSDGKANYSEMTNAGQLYVTISDPVTVADSSPDGALKLYREYADVKLLGDSEQDGVACVGFDIINKSEDGSSAGHTEMFYRKDHGVVHKSLTYGEDGKVVSTYTTTAFDPAAKLDASLFTYTPPEGAQIVDMRSTAEGNQGEEGDDKGADESGDDDMDESGEDGGEEGDDSDDDGDE